MTLNKQLLILTILFLIYGCSSSSSGDSGSWGGTDYAEPKVELSEEELKRQLEATECSYPPDYLHGDIGTKALYKGILSTKVNGLRLTVKLTNSATLATFRDVKISVQLMSKTGSTIEEERFTIYEFIKPNQTIKYNYEMSITNQQFKDYDRISWIVEGASCD